MGSWAKPELERKQAVLIPVSLEEVIPGDHPVRLFDEILRALDWRDWEGRYHGERGQPPIHPRVLCSAILYGLKRGIRSSRQLEDACANRVDFMWLVECRRIDHSTFAGFRRKFKEELKGIGKQVVHLAMHLGYVTLKEVATDGTLVKANNSRFNTSRKKTIEDWLEEVDRQLEEALRQAEERDKVEEALFGGEESDRQLPEKLRDLEKRQKELSKALEEVKKVEEAKKRNGGKERNTPGQVPMADPESRVLKNKDGGYSPNHLPLATTDGEQGLIVDADVINEGGEGAQQKPAIERITDEFGKQPERALGDGGYATSQNIADLEELGVELLTPAKSAEPGDEHPVQRAEVTAPVAEEKREELPLCPQTKRLDRTNFIYQEAGDYYVCPMGRKLEYKETRKDHRASGEILYRSYQCQNCDGCPLAEKCLSSGGSRRTVSRDRNHEAIERAAKRMETEEAKKAYSRRSWIAETPFAFIKHLMGIRQFLLRGLENVRTEWQWICTAFNLEKLVKLMAALRTESGMTEPVNLAGAICTPEAAG